MRPPQQLPPRPNAPVIPPTPPSFIRWATLCLFIFLQGIGLTRTYVMGFVGDWFNTIGAASAYGSLMLLPFLIYLYRGYSLPGEKLNSQGSMWAWSVVITSIFFCVYGLGKGYDKREIIQDFAPYLVIVGFAVIGTKRAFWDDIWTVVPFFLAISLVLNSFAIIGFSDLINTEGDRVGRETGAYRTQATLVFWSIMLLTIHGRAQWKQFVVLASMGMNFGLQILFQKRIGTAEVLGFLLVLFVIMPRFGGRYFQKESQENRRLLAILTVVTLLGAGIVLALKPGLVISQAKSLMARFSGTSELMNKSKTGFFNAVFVENERVEIAKEMFTDFSYFEWIVGRGMGGYFQVFFEATDNEKILRERDLSYYLPDVGLYGKRGLEMGILMPFMKGGFILMIVFFSGAIVILCNLSRIKKDALTLACWFYVLLEMIYLLQGGGFIMSSSFRLIMFGACLGRCFVLNPIPMIGFPRIPGLRPGLRPRLLR